jgi:hypothetical protein
MWLYFFNKEVGVNLINGLLDYLYKKILSLAIFALSNKIIE